jgi:uncharacterized membrane protein
MKKLLKRTFEISFFVAFFGAVVGSRFANPHMTETELFLSFWYIWLIALPVGIALWFLIDSATKGKAA